MAILNDKTVPLTPAGQRSEDSLRDNRPIFPTPRPARGPTRSSDIAIGNLRTALIGPDASDYRLDAAQDAIELEAAGVTSDELGKALAFTLGRFGKAEPKEIGVLAQTFRAEVFETVRRISSLKAASRADNLGVAFQPIVALGSLQIHHHELLARFDRHTSPAEMIRFAEQIGLIEEIDLTMCRRAIAILGDRGGAPLDLAVNISGKSLDSDQFVDGLMKLLAPHASLSKQLLFEITESTAIQDLPRVERILTVLRKAGYRICLDDFGAGASSFSYLQALSVDFVKIDGSYITRMRDSAKDRAILKAMVTMCRDLGVGMIAEMIERVDQAHDLLAMGIVYGQGYLFGRPASTPFAATLANAVAPARSADIKARMRA